jgi:2-octaprenylphenol hydroxylase
MTKNYDVIIIGGGIVGLTFACSLPAKLRVAVLESKPSNAKFTDKYDLRVSAINHDSQHNFANIHVWDAMQKMRVSPFRGMQVWDTSGQGSIEFDCLQIAAPCLGYIIENRVMQQALHECIKKIGVDYISPAQPQALQLQENNIVLKLEDGSQLTSELIVGADGANSWVREQSAIDINTWPYQHNAIVTTIKTELPHQQIARQWFLADGILALLPLQEKNHCSIVWSTTPEQALRLQRLSELEFNAALTVASARCLGELQKLDALQIFPLQMRHAKHYVKQRVALIGDAAHTIHPLAGQGVNLGLLDAAKLAEVVAAAAEKNRDIGALDTLRRYERARKGHNLLMIGLMEVFKRSCSTQQSFIVNARTTGFNLVNKSNLLKNFFMRQASGLANARSAPSRV